MNLQSWRPAVWAAFKARALTRSGRDVLLTLCTFRGREGLIFPSHATLAERVGCCERTVRAALADARDAGLVSWVRGRRTSNHYRLELPREVAPTRQPRRVERVVARLTGKWRREGENTVKKGLTGMVRMAPHPPVRTVAEQLAALMRPTSEAERQEARESLAAVAARRAAERDAARQARAMSS